MDIALYISDLLQKHDEVSVTGLGTFSKKHIGAQYDEQLEAFTPPGNRVEYSPQFYSDPRLAKYISELRNISQESSEHFIQRFSDEIQNLLNSQNTAEIAHIGTLNKTENEVSLIPSADFRSDRSAFGLKPVHEIKIKPVSPTTPDPVIANEIAGGEEIATQEPVKEIDPPAAPTGWDPVILNEISEPAEAAIEAEEPVKRRRTPVLLLVVLLVVTAAAALYLFAPESVNRYIKQQPAKKASAPGNRPETLSDSVAVADSIIQSLDQQGFEVEKPRDTIRISTSAKAVNAVQSTTFEVIGASLNKQADAERLVRNFKALGIDARIILAKDKKKNNILISLASFNTKEAAGAELVRIKNDIEPGAYIYTYNHN